MKAYKINLAIISIIEWKLKLEKNYVTALKHLLKETDEATFALNAIRQNLLDVF